MKTKKLLSFGICLLCLFGLNRLAGQTAPEQIWNVSFSDALDTSFSPVSMALDSEDNIYLVTNLKSMNNNQDIVMLKYDSLGDLKWKTTFDGGVIDYAYHISIGPSNCLLVSGVKVDASQADAAFLCKYDLDGKLIWSKTYDSGAGEFVCGAVENSAGNIILTGVRYTGGSDSDRFFVVYDKDGAQIEVIADNYPGRDRGDGEILIDGQDNIYITGFLDDQFRTTKYNPDCNTVWNHVYNPGLFDYSFDLALDLEGNVFVTGWSGNNSSYFECVIVKYDKSGQFIWDKRYNAGKYAYPTDVTTDPAGNIYLMATSLTSTSALDCVDAHIVKYGSDGKLMWDMVYDSGSQDDGKALSFGKKGNLYLICKSLKDNDYFLHVIKLKAKDHIAGVWPGLGVWSRNSDSWKWSKIIDSEPNSMASADMDGDGIEDFIGSFDIGVWVCHSNTGIWEMVHPAKAKQIQGGDADGDGKDDLIGIWDDCPGLWVKYSGNETWEKLNDISPQTIVAGRIK